jgi:hypothetical protein
VLGGSELARSKPDWQLKLDKADPLKKISSSITVDGSLTTVHLVLGMKAKMALWLSSSA